MQKVHRAQGHRGEVQEVEEFCVFILYFNSIHTSQLSYLKSFQSVYIYNTKYHNCSGTDEEAEWALERQKGTMCLHSQVKNVVKAVKAEDIPLDMKVMQMWKHFVKVL